MFVLKLLNILLPLIYLIFLVFCLFLGSISGNSLLISLLSELLFMSFDGFFYALSPKSRVVCLIFSHFLIIFLPWDKERNLLKYCLLSSLKVFIEDQYCYYANWSENGVFLFIQKILKAIKNKAYLSLSHQNSNTVWFNTNLKWFIP